MGASLVDYLIIGAGPAGLQLAQHLGASGRDYLVLESASAPGAFFTRFPRHRALISINKPHTGTDDSELNLRMDWNSLLPGDPGLLFTGYTGKYFPPAAEMVRYLADYARHYGLRVEYDSLVTSIARADGTGHGAGDGDGRFAVTDARGRVHAARRVIVATGVSQPNIPPIPGIELAEHYASMPTDPADFTNQRVLIIGKGNSAMETADNLIEKAAVIHVAGPGSVNLAWKTHYVGHVRAVNNNFLDTYQLKSQNAILDGTVQSITRGADGKLVVQFSFSRANEVVKELRYDRVLACTGFRLDASIFAPGARPALVHKDRFPVLTPAYEVKGVPGMYAAGTLTQVLDFRHGTSGFIHGFRYGVRALHKVLESRYHDQPWPSRPVGASAAELTAAVLERVNRTSALWQQFGVLGDVILRRPGAAASYLEEVPVGLVTSGGLPGAGGEAGADVLVVTLEYGPDHDKVDPFDITVKRVAQDDPDRAFDAAYLHPVVRLYRGGELAATHHVAENLENEWDKPAHHDPLEKFLAATTPAGLAGAAR